jgi:hypothetical protein
VAKLHKIAERVDFHGRAEDKDALDGLRVLRAVPMETLASGLRRLRREDLSAGVTEEEDTIRESCAVLAGERLIAMTGDRISS